MHFDLEIFLVVCFHTKQLLVLGLRRKDVSISACKCCWVQAVLTMTIFIAVKETTYVPSDLGHVVSLLIKIQIEILDLLLNH